MRDGDISNEVVPAIAIDALGFLCDEIQRPLVARTAAAVTQLWTSRNNGVPYPSYFKLRTEALWILRRIEQHTKTIFLIEKNGRRMRSLEDAMDDLVPVIHYDDPEEFAKECYRENIQLVYSNFVPQNHPLFSGKIRITKFNDISDVQTSLQNEGVVTSWADLVEWPRE